MSLQLVTAGRTKPEVKFLQLLLKLNIRQGTVPIESSGAAKPNCRLVRIEDILSWVRHPKVDEE